MKQEGIAGKPQIPILTLHDSYASFVEWQLSNDALFVEWQLHNAS